MKSIDVTNGRVTICAATTQISVACLHYGFLASRVHSQYVWQVADLPCEGQQVCLAVHVCKFCCHATTCVQKMFGEHLTTFVELQAPVTAWLYQIVQIMGLVPSSMLRARVTNRLVIQSYWMTVLQRLMALPTPSVNQMS